MSKILLGCAVWEKTEPGGDRLSKLGKRRSFAQDTKKPCSEDIEGNPSEFLVSKLKGVECSKKM